MSVRLKVYLWNLSVTVVFPDLPFFSFKELCKYLSGNLEGYSTTAITKLWVCVCDILVITRKKMIYISNWKKQTKKFNSIVF